MKIEDRLTWLKVGRGASTALFLGSLVGMGYYSFETAKCEELLASHKNATETLKELESIRNEEYKMDFSYETPEVKRFAKLSPEKRLELYEAIQSVKKPIQEIENTSKYKRYKEKESKIKFAGYGGFIALFASLFGLYKSNKKIRWIEKTIEPLKKK